MEKAAEADFISTVNVKLVETLMVINVMSTKSPYDALFKDKNKVDYLEEMAQWIGEFVETLEGATGWSPRFLVDRANEKVRLARLEMANFPK